MAEVKCKVCNKEGTTELHHIVPLSLGGPDNKANRIRLCLECHSLAHNHREEWRRLTREGIAKAKERGAYANHGRERTIDRVKVKQLREEGLSTYKIAEQMGISRMSVHRVLNMENTND